MNVIEWIIFLVILFAHFQLIKMYIDIKFQEERKQINQLEGSIDRQLFAQQELIKKFREKLSEGILEIQRLIEKNRTR